MREDLRTVTASIEDIRQGRMIIVVDDETRENEGDLIMAAEKVTPEAINFISREGRGLICVPMTGARLDELDLHPMVGKNTSIMGTAFAVSLDAVKGTTTGISAHDRATTIRALVDPDTRPSDLGRPGHIFPLRASEGGVLKRAGHTEAAVDLATLAGLTPAGVLCEIMGEDGSMARMPELERMAERF
ncbi:3,4-dihydroxy-2-butanone-4-phosphate synthase, partial [bacterium]|nr:3,4-dihydroxy-2-butanone-4-phosphate synthase [bacterium]